MEVIKLIKTRIGFRTLKTAVAATAAIFLSQLIGLSYAGNSGIIAILSVQNTKRKSINLARQRLIATLVALSIGSLMFLTFGFTSVAFGLYLLMFIPIAVRFGFHEAIVPCSVLVTHLLAIRSVAPGWLGNEFMQMVIGAGCALLVNLHIPSIETQLQADVAAIEEKLKEVLLHLASRLKSDEVAPRPHLMAELTNLLERARERVEQESSNFERRNLEDRISYLDMRLSQLEVMKHLERYLLRIKRSGQETAIVGRLTELLALQVNQMEFSGSTAEQIRQYQVHFHQMDLPASKEEFECRATLYDFVSDLELMMDLKQNYYNRTR